MCAVSLAAADDVLRGVQRLDYSELQYADIVAQPLQYAASPGSV